MSIWRISQGLENALSGRQGQVDFPAGQVTFHFVCANWSLIDVVIITLCRHR